MRLSAGRSLASCAGEHAGDEGQYAKLRRGLSTPMKKPAQERRIEPRWPVALTVLAVFFLLAVLPERVRLFPIWFPYVVAIVVIAPMAAVTLTAAKARLLRVERVITL